jgi:hypothetical protein
LVIAVLQSNYIPWRGYFDIIHDADLFIFYDEVQYTTNDWRNRNIIYTYDGPKWITIPCGRGITRRINEVTLSSNNDWQAQHFRKICEAYAKTPYFQKYKSFFEHIYLERKWDYLSDVNQFLIKSFAKDYLKIDTEFNCSTEYHSEGARDEKLLSLLLSAKCTNYLSGPAAKDYLDEGKFNKHGIKVYWKDYTGYPDYPQTRQPFEGKVSIIDLLVNMGDDSPYYIWGWREEK